MSQHRIIWSIAALAVLLATAVGLWRYRADIWSNYGQGRALRLTHTLNLLNQDPSQIQNATREAVRAVAVDVVAGHIHSAEGYLVLALQLERERSFDGAEANFRRAISLRPDWSWPHMALGGLLTRQTDARRDEAEAELRAAIGLNPNWGRPHDNLAVLLRMEGRFDEAEAAARRALELEPESLAAHNNMANLLIAQQRYGEAEEYFQQAIALDPNQAKPHYNLACLYSIIGRRHEALSALEDAIQRAGILRNEAASDPDFTGIRDTPEFQRLVFGTRGNRAG